MVYIQVSIIYILLFVLKTIINDKNEWDLNYMTLKVKPSEKGTNSAAPRFFFLPDQYQRLCAPSRLQIFILKSQYPRAHFKLIKPVFER